jgi:hypothetical protein
MLQLQHFTTSGRSLAFAVRPEAAMPVRRRWNNRTADTHIHELPAPTSALNIHQMEFSYSPSDSSGGRIQPFGSHRQS